MGKPGKRPGFSLAELRDLRMPSGRYYQKHFIAASAFIAIWFIMDLVQFVDWSIQHIWPSAVMCR
jgi:hypothetical protein